MYLALKRSTTQGSFFKNNSLTSFHPLLLKALLFSEIASPSSVPPPPPCLPPSPSPPQPSPLCHVLVFICWFCSSSFSPCVKNERPKIGWVRGGRKGSRRKQQLYIGEITVCSAETALFSALTVTDYNTAPEPHPYTSHSCKPNLHP